jgi:hypothetical protein
MQRSFLSPYTFTSTSTPAGNSSLINESIVFWVELKISINLLCILASNCSRDFLSTCGERNTVYTLRFVGSGIGPDTIAPVCFTVRTIRSADLSIKL